MRFVANALHERDRKHTGGADVGDGGAGNGPHQTGANYGDLRWTACRPAGESHRQVNDELPKACFFKHGSKEDEHEDKRR